MANTPKLRQYIRTEIPVAGGHPLVTELPIGVMSQRSAGRPSITLSSMPIGPQQSGCIKRSLVTKIW